jgi:hypothetical protein
MKSHGKRRTLAGYPTFNYGGFPYYDYWVALMILHNGLTLSAENLKFLVIQKGIN